MVGRAPGATSREGAMAYVERELVVVGEENARDYAEFKVRRGKNRWSKAVDAMRENQVAK